MNADKEARYEPSMNRTLSCNIVLLFLVLVCGFTIASILKPQDERSETENRSLAQRPAFTFESLLSGQFAKDYESYLSDQFPGRNGWITLRTDVERAAGKQDISDVYFAGDDYLIEKHTGTFTSRQAQANVGLLSSWAEDAAQKVGPGHLTVMIVPNAVDILRDKLPPLADPYDEEIYLDRIKASLPEGTYFDVSSVLRSHKDEEIYYRTDHHWKTLAAWYVYQAWTGALGLEAGTYTPTTVTENFEGTISSKLGINGRPDSIERYDPDRQEEYELTYNQSDDVRRSIYQDSYLDTKDKYSYFYGGNNALIESKVKGNGSGRSLLIIKDSYAHCFAPFTYGNFDQVDLLDLRYYNSSLSELMEKKQYTDILFLQNAAGFAEETSLAKLGT